MDSERKLSKSNVEQVDVKPSFVLNLNDGHLGVESPGTKVPTELNAEKSNSQETYKSRGCGFCGFNPCGCPRRGFRV